MTPTRRNQPDDPGLLTTDGFADYRLVDFGEGRKLERFGRFLVDRPEAQAMGRRRRPDLWAKADAVFLGAAAEDEAGDGRWKFAGRVPETFPVSYGSVPSSHGSRRSGISASSRSRRRVGLRGRAPAGARTPGEGLNLFGYTGVASLVAAKAGASVTHVDASKKVGRLCAREPGARDARRSPIRWIVDERSNSPRARRGAALRYDGIILDPPKYGRGAERRGWDLFPGPAAHARSLLCRAGRKA